jgi:hypothetical protein
VSDYTLPPCSTLIVGMTGSGKSTLAYRAVLNFYKECACIFVFDDLGEGRNRLGPILGCYHASTADQLEQALKTRIVVFNPHPMFHGTKPPKGMEHLTPVERGFRFFCDWVMECCMDRGSTGHKILLIDEVWRFQTPQGIPQELAAVSQMGRAQDLELMTCTQLPHKLHASLTGQSTELIAFRLDEPLALARVRELGLNPDEVRKLPLGQFIALNRLTRARLDGRVF